MKTLSNKFFQKCKICQKSKIKIKSYFSRKGFIYKDIFGGRWDGIRCHPCSLKYYKKYNRKRYKWNPLKKVFIGENKKFICSLCKKEGIKKAIYKRDEKYSYFDEKEKRIYGGRCNACGLKHARELYYKKNKTMDNISFPKLKKAREAERCVESYYNNLGYKTKINNGAGPDLIIYPKNEKPFSVEVKTITRKKRCNSYQIGSVKKDRRKDDLLAIVFPKKKIYFEPMKKHLIQCSKSGVRTVTNIVNYYNQIEE